MSVTFTHDETTVTLPDPSPGYPVRGARRQLVGRTAGGVVYVYDKGIDTYEVDLPFESLTDAEKASLVDFFENTVSGGLQVFTYTDSAETARTARFIDPHLDFTKVVANVWDVRVRLELDSMGG